jgi:phosphinothricin tripeptide acetyl hydrolase
MLGREVLQKMADAYAPGEAARHPSASPVFEDLTGLPPLLIQVGTAEVLLDDSRALAERACAAGVDVVLEEWDELFHVFHNFARILPEAMEAIERIGVWLDTRWR